MISYLFNVTATKLLYLYWKANKLIKFYSNLFYLEAQENIISHLCKAKQIIHLPLSYVPERRWDHDFQELITIRHLR